MTIENLKQIAIKYATTKGSRVPLAPDELCNAVVQYFNEFLKITADINTIQVAVTEEGGNIVFTITGNTLDGKAFTPIVITVDHNDFVTNQEFEEFKTTTNAAIQKNTESINSLSFRVEDTENDITTIQVQVGQINTRVGNTETNIAKINSTLNNKLDKIISVSNSNQVYGKSAAGENLMYNLGSHPNAGYVLQYDSDGNIYVNKGSSEYTPANMQNISDVEAKIPDVTNLADVTKENTESINSLSFRVEDTENDITTIQVQVGQINTRVGNTETNIAKINSTLNNKLDKIISVSNSNQVYGKSAAGENLMYNLGSHPNAGYVLQYDSDGNIYVNKGSSEYTPANMQNISDVEAKIPDVTNLADVTKENTFTDVNHFTQYITTFGVEIGELEFNDDEYDVSISNATIEIFHYISGGNANSIRITDEQIWVKRYDVSDYTSFNFPNKSGTLALTSDIPEYTNVDSVSYDSTNGAIVAYDGANEIHIPLLAGENVTIDASEDNKKIVISAAGGGGTGDVTAAGNNTFTGENTFNNSIYAKNGVVAGDTTNYGANSVTKGSNTYSFPNKSGTFAMTTDIIKNPIYFISFYANDPSEPCHLIGTMMSKNSYGTGQKTNEEFAVMLKDNLYTNSNEGLAAYGKLANKDILCIYSEDGLSIRCLDEENSEVDLPTVMFFVMETEL